MTEPYRRYARTSSPEGANARNRNNDCGEAKVRAGNTSLEMPDCNRRGDDAI